MAAEISRGNESPRGEGRWITTVHHSLRCLWRANNLLPFEGPRNRGASCVLRLHGVDGGRGMLRSKRTIFRLGSVRVLLLELYVRLSLLRDGLEDEVFFVRKLRVQAKFEYFRYQLCLIRSTKVFDE